MLDIRRLSEGERRVNDILRPQDARDSVGVVPVDPALWASEIRYWRGFADALYFAMTIVETTVASHHIPEPPAEKKEVTDGN